MLKIGTTSLNAHIFHLFLNPYIGLKLINASVIKIFNHPQNTPISQALQSVKSSFYPIGHLHSFIYLFIYLFIYFQLYI